jgi:hypothetical protein
MIGSVLMKLFEGELLEFDRTFSVFDVVLTFIIVVENVGVPVEFGWVLLAIWLVEGVVLAVTSTVVAGWSDWE